MLSYLHRKRPRMEFERMGVLFYDGKWRRASRYSGDSFPPSCLYALCSKQTVVAAVVVYIFIPRDTDYSDAHPFSFTSRGSRGKVDSRIFVVHFITLGA